jgi:hypothetical protein
MTTVILQEHFCILQGVSDPQEEAEHRRYIMTYERAEFAGTQLQAHVPWGDFYWTEFQTAPLFIKATDTLLCLYQPAPASYHEPGKSTPSHSSAYPSNITPKRRPIHEHRTVSLSLTGLGWNIACISCVALRAACPAHLTLRDLITVTIYNKNKNSEEHPNAFFLKRVI